ncbi:anticodon-binding protein [Absidia repens]|uniref:Anticodon-binding protein n=1 Tax=Absidia repens TaxID=90262 RepID=A0A1X2I6R7_9FUNG|nr:anticodon-binding protein [Absidia repens]
MAQKPFDRTALEKLITKRSFMLPSKSMEVCRLDTTIMNDPQSVETSGHVDKFADWMCKDLKNGEIYRADHVVEAVLEAYLQGDLQARAAKIGTEAQVKVENGGELNLMFVSSIGPTEHIREYTPNVIGRSFGIGRILYSPLEHSWCVRDGDESRNVMSFPTVVASFKRCLLPLSGDACLTSLGRRYARNDELGIPFAITVDFQTVEDNTITLRQRDSTEQIGDSFKNILKILRDSSSDY